MSRISPTPTAGPGASPALSASATSSLGEACSFTPSPVTSPLGASQTHRQLHTPAVAMEDRPAHEVNVGGMERLASMAVGGGLAAFGLTRASLPGLGLAALGGALIYRGTTGHCTGYDALGINTAEPRRPATGVRAQQGCRVEKQLLINRSPEELFSFWRNVENLPRIMHHLESVHSAGDLCSHWVAKGPMGVKVEWDAEVINERDGEMIAWRSVEGSQVDTAGSVHFERAPQGRGTFLKLSIKYDPPGGKLGAGIAGLLGDSLEQQLDQDLRDFKALMEAGETPTTEGQSACRI